MEFTQYLSESRRIHPKLKQDPLVVFECTPREIYADFIGNPADFQEKWHDLHAHLPESTRKPLIQKG